MFDEYDFDMNFHFFGDDDMSPDERAKLERDLRARIDMARNHPLALKAKEIHTIVDALGKVIAKSNMTDSKTQINTSNLDKGLYFLTVTSNNGEAAKTIKLVK